MLITCEVSHKNALFEAPVLSACVRMRLFQPSLDAVLWNTETGLLAWGVQELQQLEAAAIWGVGRVS